MTRSLRVVALVSLFALACSGCTWSMFGFGPDNTRFNPVVTNLSASNVGTMVLKGTGKTTREVSSSPAVVTTDSNGHVTGTVYVGSQDGKLYAFDEFGSTNCSGTPASCTPLWTATTGATITSSPAVVHGVVYIGSWDKKLYAYDAAGVKQCSGAPKHCGPMWTGLTDGALVGAPTLANGVVYVVSNQGTLYAFDAAGTTGCSGAPKTCAPLWTAPNAGAGPASTAPAVANGVVFTAGNGALSAFDAAGIASCSGTPKTCAPLWTAPITATTFEAPAVANGVVYELSFDFVPNKYPFPGGTDYGTLSAFDAAGTQNCSGTPKTCTELWSANAGNGGNSSIAIANGIIYVPGGGTISAYSATDCAQAGFCNPLWTTTSLVDVSLSSPAIENGVLFIGVAGDFNLSGLYAFDATGSTNCSGSPKVCAPLFSTTVPNGIRSSPSPAGDTVFVGADDDNLYAFGLP